MKKTLVLTLLLSSLFMSCEQLKKEKVDLIVHNAIIYTVNDGFEKAEAMAIDSGRIVAVGPEHEIRNKYEGRETLDLRMKFVYPGFIDGHCHFTGYGLSLQQVDLTGTKSWDECLERISEFAEKHPEGWITGRGWDQNDWADKSFPDNRELNQRFPDRPVFVRRVDGHAGIANTAALKLAGITEKTEIVGGDVKKYGEVLTGLLVDNAMEPVLKAIPEPDETLLRKALTEAQKNCFAVGLTGVDDAGISWRDVALIEKMHADSTLKIRVYAMLSDAPENYAYFLEQGPLKTDRLSVRSFKYYIDGALGSRGAALLEPYSDDPDNSGLILTDPDYLRQQAQKLHDAGFQINTHCIGDSANRLVLQVYGDILGGSNDKRWRIEHAQVLAPEDFSLFGKYNIIPSVQPTHATSDMYWAEERLGPERIKYAYAYKELLKQNGLLALGTDFPVEDIDPLNTFYAAVFRRDHTGFPEGGFEPGNALTREEALRGMTIWNAIANFEENEKGSLEPGKFADFVVLNIDLMTVPQEDFDQVKVEMTFIDGERVY